MSDAAFTRILSDLGEHLGIPALAPNDAGLCQLVFDERHAVHLVHMAARGHVLMSCPLDLPIPNAAQLAVIARSNFMQAAGGAVLCIAPDDRVCAQLGLPDQDCRPQRLLAAIEALLDEAQRWEIALAEHQPAASAPHGRPGMYLQV